MADADDDQPRHTLKRPDPMDSLERTPEADRLLKASFATIKERWNFDPSDAVFCAMETLQFSSDSAAAQVTPYQKFLILCSALYTQVTYQDDLGAAHPYSEAGYILSEAISAFVMEGIWQAEKQAKIEQDTLHAPSWLKQGD